MYDYQTVKLMHVHAGERIPMVERSHHDPADHDPERGWPEGVRVFRCTTCEDEIVIMPAGHDQPGPGPG